MAPTVDHLLPRSAAWSNKPCARQGHCRGYATTTEHLASEDVLLVQGAGNVSAISKTLRGAND